MEVRINSNLNIYLGDAYGPGHPQPGPTDWSPSAALQEPTAPTPIAKNFRWKYIEHLGLSPQRFVLDYFRWQLA